MCVSLRDGCDSTEHNNKQRHVVIVCQDYINKVRQYRVESPINPRNATKAYHKEKEAPPTEVVTLEVEDLTTDIQRDKQLNITTSDDHKTNRNTEPHQSSTKNTRDAHIDLFCETRDQCKGQSAANTSVTATLASNPGGPQTIFTSESPEANNDHEPCKAIDYHVPRRIGEQVHPTSQPMTSWNAE